MGGNMQTDLTNRIQTGDHETFIRLLYSGADANVRNDVARAVRAYRENKDCGSRIPDDTAVIGFDGLGFAPHLEQPSRTFEVNHDPIYGEAAHLLISRILGEFQEETQQVFQTQLVPRKSTRDRGTVR